MTEQPPVCWPHHYLLETPHGSPTVTGTCKKCGHTRTYGASEESMLELGGMPFLWDGAMTLKRSRPRRMSEDPSRKECKLCARPFTTAAGRATHERTCGSEDRKCPDCGGVKITKSALTCRPCRAKRAAATLQRRQVA